MKGSLGLGASLAATAVQAIVIPSTMSVGGDDPNAMMMAGIDPFNQLVKAECRGCLYAQPINTEMGPGFMWTQDVDNSLVANFSISQDMKTLDFNGVRLYPTEGLLFPTQHVTPMIAQVPQDASLAEVQDKYASEAVPLRVTAWGSGTRGQPTEDGKDLILTINVNIAAIEGHSVDVPEITVTMLKNQDENLMMLRTEVSKDAPASKMGSAPQEECHSTFAIFCKWKHILADKLSALGSKFQGKGCKGKGQHQGMGMHHHHRPAPVDRVRPEVPTDEKEAQPSMGEDWGEEARKHHRPGGHHRKPWEHKGEFKHGDHPHHHKGPHHHHKGPHRHGHHDHARHGFGRFMHFVGSFATHVLAPMILGLAIGMFLVFVGWSIAVLLSIFVMWRAGEQISWEIYMPRWRGGYAVVVDDEDDEESAPAYVDVEAGEVKDEKATFVVVEGEAPPTYIEVESKEEQE